MVFDVALGRLGAVIEEGTGWPRPFCPHCLAGHLRFDEPVQVEHGESKRARQDDYWEPEWIRGVFTASGACENPECEQPAVATGTYEVDYAKKRPHDEYTESGPPYSAFYSVKQVYPPLVLMRLPETTPEPIQEGVERAAAVLFTDPGLAATALRLVVEQFLTSEGIAATRPTGGFISADDRIKTWKKGATGRDRVADLLLAVKWIGNAGTHSLSTLTVSEVLKGVEILDEAFHAQFIGPDIDARAKAVNDARGPVSPTT
ncbi:DUF4145 domain-containing protein [Nocardioides ginsengisoli]|uniref:DUF4145 domain-containing protein n=1 Tax=Nocardioides ginsengisoli TaxID=363868 RepID=A0ABW3W7Y7_9ACTN